MGLHRHAWPAIRTVLRFAKPFHGAAPSLAFNPGTHIRHFDFSVLPKSFYFLLKAGECNSVVDALQALSEIRKARMSVLRVHQ